MTDDYMRGFEHGVSACVIIIIIVFILLGLFL